MKPVKRTTALEIASAAASGGKALSPEHKRFQALLGKIETARERLQSWQQQLPLFAQMHQAQAAPLLAQLTAERRAWALGLEQLLLNPLASSAAVLTQDEKELGVALVDIGAGTTDVAIFTGGAIRHTAVIPIAGDLITSDIAMALRTPTKDAEDIKVESGYAKQLLADPEQQVEVPGLGDRSPRMLSKQALAGVIEPRVEEIFQLVQQVIRESGYEEVLSSGIVLTGGSCVMPGMVELGEDIFLKPVRRGVAQYRGPLADMVSQPRAATVMGQLEEARNARLRGFKAAQQSGSVKTAFGRFKDFIVGNF